MHIQEKIIRYLEQCSLRTVMGAMIRLQLREEIICNHVTLNLRGHHSLCQFRHKLQVVY